MRRVLPLGMALGLSCGGAPPAEVVALPPRDAGLAVAPRAPLALRLRRDSRPRFLTSIGVLHEPAGSGRGRDFRIDGEGRATRLDGDPFASMPVYEFFDVAGDWPRIAWARVDERGADDDVGARAPVARRIVHWDGTEWILWDHVDPPAPPAADRDRLPRASLLALAPWGEEDALTMAFQFGEEPSVGGLPDPWEERCEPDVALVAAAEKPLPPMRLEWCALVPHAVATSATSDLFLLVQPRLGRPLRKDLIAWGPPQLHRWSRGQIDPARDDLAAMIGFRPGILDPWAQRTLLVVDATDAYLAVTTSPAASPFDSVPARDAVVAIPQGPSTPSADTIVVLHFDGQRWSEALRAPPPWGGMERAPDGSIWVVVGSGVHVAPPTAAASGARAFMPVAIAPMRSRGGLHPVEPLQVMPRSARRASVIARYGDELGLFTVERSDDMPPVGGDPGPTAPPPPGPAARVPQPTGPTRTKNIREESHPPRRQPAWPGGPELAAHHALRCAEEDEHEHLEDAVGGGGPVWTGDRGLCAGRARRSSPGRGPAHRHQAASG